MTNDFSLGWVKLHRKLLNWEWYGDVNVRITFIHCLLLANYEDKNWRGKLIPRGSFISSTKNLSKQIGISEMKLRTAIKKLILTSEITSVSSSTDTMFTILSYDSYQTDNERDNKQVTNEQQTDNKGVTTTKEVNNLTSKEDKKTNANKLATGVIEYYNGVCVNLPKVLTVNASRKKVVAAREKEYGKDEIKQVIDLASESSFLNGDNSNAWAASFDWIMKTANFTKILEGNYKNKENEKDKRNFTREQFEHSIDKHFPED
jgi:hypothetical protein